MARTAEDCFLIVKKAHERRVAIDTDTYIEIPGSVAQQNLIKKYLRYIGYYQVDKQRYLGYAVTQPSSREGFGRGVLSSLLGIGATQLVVNAVDIPQTAKTAFSLVIGASVSSLIYKLWSSSTKKPAETDFATFQADMTAAGFTDEKYAAISAHIVKLFHFRECLLLNLPDTSAIQMRTEFKHKYLNITQYPDDNTLNAAIELYFLEQLNSLFAKAFQEIYLLHEQQIKSEQNAPVLISWFNQYFSNKDSRKQFSLQLQIEFMNRCLSYLEYEMLEPSFMVHSFYLTMGIIGLIFATVAMSIAAISLSMGVFGITSIGLAAACIGAILYKTVINHCEILRYKRDPENRAAIHQVILSLSQEQKRLASLIRMVVTTSDRDIRALKKYEDLNQEQGLFRLKNFKHIAVGAVAAWLREYAARYQHSRFIEIDLGAILKDLITQSNAQTNELITALSLNHIKKLTRFVDDTRVYLLDPQNALFRTKFELILKIREQILDVIASVEINFTIKNIPQSLLQLYIDPIDRGGLGGQIYDLEYALLIRHPLTEILRTALNLNIKLTMYVNSAWILHGDELYRSQLGLSNTIQQLTFTNIQKYLDNSFEFLYSLNQYPPQIKLDDPVKNSFEFILYKMLLIKQLATLVLGVGHTDPAIKDCIIRFVKQKFSIEADLVFDDILNHALFLPDQSNTQYIPSPIGTMHSAAELNFVMHAILLDVAYTSNSTSLRQFIQFSAKDFGHPELTCDKFIPELNPEFYQTIDKTVSATKDFFKTLAAHPVLQKTNAIIIYSTEVIQDVQKLLNKIAKFKSHLLAEALIDIQHLQQLDMSFHILEQFIVYMQAQHGVVSTNDRRNSFFCKTMGPKLDGNLQNITKTHHQNAAAK